MRLIRGGSNLPRSQQQAGSMNEHLHEWRAYDHWFITDYDMMVFQFHIPN